MRSVVEMTSLTLLLGGLVAACGPMLIPELDEAATGETGEDVEVEEARRGVTETRCALVGRRLDLEQSGEDMSLLAAGLEPSGARLLVRRGETTPVLLELDLPTGRAELVAALAPGHSYDLQFSKAAFDQDGPRVAICDRRDGQHGLRVVEESGAESWRPFKTGAVPQCTQVSASDDAWLVLAKEWGTDAPGTLLKLAQDDDDDESRLDLDVSMRSPVDGEALLLATGQERFAFLYRPFEQDSWPGEPLRVLRLDRDFTVAGEPIELVEQGLQNGAVARTALGDDLAVVFTPRNNTLPAGTVPHLLTLHAEGSIGMPVPLTLASEHAGRVTLHANAEDMFWAWVDLPDFDPSTATSSLHRIVLQPIDRSGTPTGPLVVVAQTGSANATNLSLHSRRIENRVELLLAWQTAGADVEHTTVHAAALNCQ